MRVCSCEKPNQGKDIARVLGATGRGEGCIRGEGMVVGHRLDQAPPEAQDPQLKAWSPEALSILLASWKVEVKRKTSRQSKVVKTLLDS